MFLLLLLLNFLISSITWDIIQFFFLFLVQTIWRQAIVNHMVIHLVDHVQNVCNLLKKRVTCSSIVNLYDFSVRNTHSWYIQFYQRSTHDRIQLLPLNCLEKCAVVLVNWRKKQKRICTKCNWESEKRTKRNQPKKINNKNV